MWQLIQVQTNREKIGVQAVLAAAAANSLSCIHIYTHTRTCRDARINQRTNLKSQNKVKEECNMALAIERKWNERVQIMTAVVNDGRPFKEYPVATRRISFVLTKDRATPPTMTRLENAS